MSVEEPIDVEIIAVVEKTEELKVEVIPPSIAPPTVPFKSLKHEAALNELKTFIHDTVALKLDDLAKKDDKKTVVKTKK